MHLLFHQRIFSVLYSVKKLVVHFIKFLSQIFIKILAQMVPNYLFFLNGYHHTVSVLKSAITPNFSSIFPVWLGYLSNLIPTILAFSSSSWYFQTVAYQLFQLFPWSVGISKQPHTNFLVFFSDQLVVHTFPEITPSQSLIYPCSHLQNPAASRLSCFALMILSVSRQEK